MKTNVKTSTGKNKVVEDSNVYTDHASYSLTQRKFEQLTLKWLSGARVQDKNKQDYKCFGFFLIFIQFCDSRKIHYLTREFRVKLHLKTDRFFRCGNKNSVHKITRFCKCLLLKNKIITQLQDTGLQMYVTLSAASRKLVPY